MEAYKEALVPVGILETELVAETSKMKWRQKRVSSVEDSIYASGHLDHANNMNTGDDAVDSCLAEGQVWKEQAKNLMLISLYETRIRRAVEKAIRTISRLPSARINALRN
jgi:hypothetical protein